MRQDPDSPQAPMPPDLDQMMADAQDTLQQGMQTLTEWGNQARQILKDRPGAVVASVAIAGFMTGALLRQKRLRTQATGKLTADPMVMFAAAAVAGFTMGPKILSELGEQPEEQSVPPVRKPLP